MTNKSGFTLSEAMIAGMISVVVIGLAMNYFVEELDIWREQIVVNELHINLESSMEYFRRDLRLSSVGTDLMSFYPADSNVYTAISFPLATDDDGDDMLERDADDKVIWDQTVIYHIRRGTPDELIRTVFDNRKTDATTAEFYTQLEDVVDSDDFTEIQAAAMAGETVTSATIFENLVDMTITPPDVVFDGYNANESHYGSFNFGSVVLGNGIHELVFTCAGKNGGSSAYKVGIDLLRMSHSMSPREGELFAVNNKRPASPYFQHAVSGGTVDATDMGAIGPDWSESAQLTWTPSAQGDTLTLYVKNDLWNDTTFISPVPQLYDGTVNAWEEMYKTNVSDIGLAEDVIKPSEGIAFNADASADSTSYLTLTNKYINWYWDSSSNKYYGVYYDTNLLMNIYDYNSPFFWVWARIEGSGGTNDDTVIQREGNWARFEWTAGAEPYIVAQPSVVEYVNGTSPQLTHSITFGGNNTVTVPANTTVWSDWLPNYPINEDSDYVIFYRAANRYPNTFAPYDATNSGGTNAVPLFNRADGYMSSQVGVHYQSGWTYVNYLGSVGFSGIEVRPASNTYFLSGIFDTQHTDSDYKVLTWTHHEPFPDGDIDMRVRSSANEDMSSPSAWNAVNYHQGPGPNNISAVPDNRYVQYEGMFTTANSHTNVAQLRDTTIQWDVAGEGLVDLRVDFAQGPDYGMVTATVNSQKFVKAVNIDMTIYKDTARWGRKSVSGSIEIKPLNTDK